VARLIVTASGGPFRGRSAAELATVTPEDALAHPTWDMGPVITINSATLMNKGLEVIEAHLLFGLPFERIEVVVHPQSLVHAMVEFHDGSTMAQLSLPDMRLPIGLALGWPRRSDVPFARLDWSRARTLEFAPVDRATFPLLDLAVAAGAAAGTAPAVLNAANEEAVAAFMARRLPFPGIAEVVTRVLDAHRQPAELDLDAVLAAEQWSRGLARTLVDDLSVTRRANG
jgi:1-deoxy-D-xylulose-5-phosphate reductoisomerase